MHSFVTNRLDYCNSLLAGAPAYLLADMQRVLNSAARLLLNEKRSQHNLRPLVRDNLHWLRVPQRIDYKVCLTVYKALHGLAPSYLTDLCVPAACSSNRDSLRTAGIKGELIVPRHKLETYGPRSFCIAGPTTWNNLPATIRDPNLSLGEFQTLLKTHLFRESYDLI